MMSQYRVAKPKRPSHRWTENDRVVLCLLKCHFKTGTRKFTTSLFSELNRSRLNLEGFQNDIPETSLDAQLAEMKTFGTGHEIWTLISNLTRNEAEQYYPTQVKKIHDAAQRLNLSFQHDITSNEPSKTIPRENPFIEGKRAKPRSISASTIAKRSVDNRERDTIDNRLTEFLFNEFTTITNTTTTTVSSSSSPSNLRRFMSSTPLPPMLRSNTDLQGNLSRKHPILLFRACEDPLHFRSRKYSDPSIQIETPPEFNTNEFRDIVWPHLRRSRAYQSPFISYAQSARNALRRIELAKAEDDSKELCLAIFAHDDIQEDAKARFGTNEIPYLVSTLFEKDVESDLPDGYTGKGEVRILNWSSKSLY